MLTDSSGLSGHKSYLDVNKETGEWCFWRSEIFGMPRMYQLERKVNFALFKNVYC